MERRCLLDSLASYLGCLPGAPGLTRDDSMLVLERLAELMAGRPPP